MSEAPGNQKQPEFKLHRSSPADQGGGGVPPLGPLVALVVLAALGFGAYKLMQPASPAPSPSAQPSPTSTIDPSEIVDVPDSVYERLDFLVSEGNLDRAIEEGREKLKLYPNPALERRLAQLVAQRSQGAGQPAEQSVAELLAQAKQAHEQGQWERVVELTSKALQQDARQGMAYFFRANARAQTGDRQGMDEDLEAAQANGIEPARVQALREKLR